MTLPTTKSCGTPGGVLKSHGSRPVVGVCGYGLPFASPFVLKYSVPLIVCALTMRSTIRSLGAIGSWKTMRSLFG